MKPNSIIIYLHAAVLLAVACMLPSCSTTRRIPEGEQRYTGHSISLDEHDGSDVPDGVKEALDNAVDAKPVNTVWWKRYPLPIGLWVYNNWPNPPKGIKHWIYEKLSEEPVLVSDVRPELRARMIDDILDNNGYFRGRADYRIDTARNVRKASVRYSVSTGPAYLLDSIELLPDTPACIISSTAWHRAVPICSAVSVTAPIRLAQSAPASPTRCATGATISSGPTISSISPTVSSIPDISRCVWP